LAQISYLNGFKTNLWAMAVSRGYYLNSDQVGKAIQVEPTHSASWRHPEMTQDWIALLTSFVYVFAAIGIAEGLRK